MNYTLTLSTLVHFIDCVQVLDVDVDNPQGLAVDWAGNNVYFSHGNRIEVASCNGEHRRVLRGDVTNAGPIAIDLSTG